MKATASSSSKGPMDAVRFFDRLGSEYASRYEGKDLFHRYFFGERTAKAIQGLQLTDGHVLDIGSGTGDLYAILKQRFPRVRFIGTDVSAGMLAHSKVPAGQRLLGHVYDHDLGTQPFDAIFMLGVSTYMDRDELDKNLAHAARHLGANGKIIVTFTNKFALDTWARALAGKLAGNRGRAGKHVLSSKVKIHRYGYREIRSIMERHFRIQRWDVLNHTVFPLNRLFPRASIRMARYLSPGQGAPGWLRPLSSDLMVHAVGR